MNQSLRRHHGFAAIAAVFLLVVLAALGGFMLTFSNTQQLTAAQDVRGSRAYWAAHAGLEWALAGITNAVPPAVLPAPACPVGAPATIDGFNIAITCNAFVYNEGAGVVTLFRVESTASAGTVGTVGYVERSLSASMENGGN